MSDTITTLIASLREDAESFNLQYYGGRTAALERVAADALERLLKERDDFKAERDGFSASCGGFIDDITKLKAEIERLQGEVERLRAALDRHSVFKSNCISLVRDARLVLLQGTYDTKQAMDARIDAWLKRVDGPKLTSMVDYDWSKRQLDKPENEGEP